VQKRGGAISYEDVENLKTVRDQFQSLGIDVVPMFSISVPFNIHSLMINEVLVSAK
jgi:hypothetical protein